MKVYKGLRTSEEIMVWIEEEGARSPAPLPMRNDIRNHSPDGPNWGYGGSGPAQLALALMCQVTDRFIAEQIYQHFKFKVVAGWKTDSWVLTKGQLQQWVDRHIAEHPAVLTRAREREEMEKWLGTLKEDGSPGPTQTGIP
jgi:hypothetical protein